MIRFLHFWLTGERGHALAVLGAVLMFAGIALRQDPGDPLGLWRAQYCTRVVAVLMVYAGWRARRQEVSHTTR